MKDKGTQRFKEYTLEEAVGLLNGERTNWPYAEHTARIAICAKSNGINVWESAKLLGYWETEADINETDEDIINLANWLIEVWGLGNMEQ